MNANKSVSFKYKTKIAGKIENGIAKYVKIMVSLKNISNFWRTLELPLLNFEIKLLIWSANCFVIDALIANRVPTFFVTDTKCSSCNLTQDDRMQVQQLKSSFKRKIYWNKYQ